MGCPRNGYTFKCCCCGKLCHSGVVACGNIYSIFIRKESDWQNPFQLASHQQHFAVSSGYALKQHGVEKFCYDSCRILAVLTNRRSDLLLYWKSCVSWTIAAQTYATFTCWYPSANTLLIALSVIELDDENTCLNLKEITIFKKRITKVNDVLKHQLIRHYYTISL